MYQQIENRMAVDEEWPDEELQIVYYCSDCGEPIYEGDDYYEIAGDIICEKCIDNYKHTAERKED